MSPPLLPSTTSLLTCDGVVQARFELHRATDFGGEAERAAWAAKWGEPALEAADRLALVDPDEDYGWVSGAADDFASALEHAASLKSLASAEAPDMAAIKSRTSRLLERLQAISGRLEDGE